MTLEHLYSTVGLGDVPKNDPSVLSDGPFLLKKNTKLSLIGYTGWNHLKYNSSIIVIFLISIN